MSSSNVRRRQLKQKGVLDDSANFAMFPDVAREALLFYFSGNDRTQWSSSELSRPPGSCIAGTLPLKRP